MTEVQTAKTLYATRALLPDGWGENVAVTVAANGLIQAVEQNLPAAPVDSEKINGVLLPGIANCHSHSFQRIIVGLTERRSASEDNFWTWREVMYRSLETIDPDDLQVITEQLYIEMLKHGYTSVAEFHYLHHRPDGGHYDDPAEMSHRVITAARTVGIQITHLPVLYAYSDFGEQPPTPGQRRFIHSESAYQSLLQSLYRHYGDDPQVNLGIAPHSLRAVSAGLLDGAIACVNELDSTAPIHMHIAEQVREVEASIASTGMRPVAWLLDHVDVDSRWCLVHATHLSANECKGLARSGAVAGLCPTTEANLGDGIFPAADYLRQGGQFAVGSDSQVSANPVDELRQLEYAQRLTQRKRALLADQNNLSVGETLYRKALAGGAQALGVNCGAVAAGKRADLLVLDDQTPTLYAKQGSAIIDSWIFSGYENPVKDVMVGGNWVVRDRQHNQQEITAEQYRRVMRKWVA